MFYYDVPFKITFICKYGNIAASCSKNNEYNFYSLSLPFMSCIKKFYKTHTKPLNCGIENLRGVVFIKQK